MLYDKFCNITEKKLLPSHAEDLKMLRDLKLFWFEPLAHDLPNTFVNPDSVYLPYQSVGIEDKASLIIFNDVEPDQVGFECQRDFIEVLSTHSTEGFNDHGKFDDIKDQARLHNEIISIARGRLVKITNYKDTSFRDSHRWRAEGYMTLMDTIDYTDKEVVKVKCDEQIIHEWCIARGHDIYKALNNPLIHDTIMYDWCLSNTLRNVMASLQEISFLNSSNHFILEDTPIKKRKLKKGHLHRSHERSKYIMLKPSQIRSKLGIDDAVGGSGRRSPRPHDRRAHPRVLNRGTDKQRVIRVKSSWIGPSQAQTSKRIYKVILDR